jgi:hypothetical protein
MTRTLLGLPAANSTRSKFAGALAFLDAIEAGATQSLAAHIAERAQIQAFGYTAVSRFYNTIYPQAT